jgi:hypothetical protein
MAHVPKSGTTMFSGIVIEPNRALADAASLGWVAAGRG